MLVARAIGLKYHCYIYTIHYDQLLLKLSQIPGGEVDCETESSQSSGGLNQAGAIAVTFFVTLIITAVLTTLVVFLLLYFLIMKK